MLRKTLTVLLILTGSLRADVWFDAEYLFWRIKDICETPLVVEGPGVADKTPRLGAPNTRVVLQSEEPKWRSGGRFTLGSWCDCEKSLGAEVRYFFLPKVNKCGFVSSNGLSGAPFLSIPYFDVTTGRESSVAIASPAGQFSGRAAFKLSNSMQGAELNFLTTLPTFCDFTFGLLAGFRWWNFNECFAFKTSSPYVAPNRVDVFKTAEKFDVRNNFYGGQIGAKFEIVCDCFFINMSGKIALGNMHRTSNIQGHLLTNDFDNYQSVQKFSGGYFALPSNIGHHCRNTFSILPEWDAALGYQLTDCLRIQIGYTFLLLTDVLYAGPDRRINPTQSSTIEFTANPSFDSDARPGNCAPGNDLWVQGLKVGMELKF